MSWDNATLIILATFGCTTLLLTQIAEVLSKLPEIIRAWHEVRRALQARSDAPSPQEADESSNITSRGNAQDDRHHA
ncbi:hypothetical protein [Streptomyces atroolivaceus]|uniref:hypothetical protein n=1 Tax=Streptomyces atroolivaceus TaxID=66869 RepID=UPI00362746D4